MFVHHVVAHQNGCRVSRGKRSKETICSYCQQLFYRRPYHPNVCSECSSILNKLRSKAFDPSTMTNQKIKITYQCDHNCSSKCGCTRHLYNKVEVYPLLSIFTEDDIVTSGGISKISFDNPKLRYYDRPFEFHRSSISCNLGVTYTIAKTKILS